MYRQEIGEKVLEGRKHIKHVGGETSPAEIYPEDLCKEVLRGLRDQMVIDGRLHETGVGCVFAMEEGETELVFYDDVSGEVLDWDGVIEARAEEIKEFHKHGVYHKVPIQECYDKTGKGPVETKWIDINKGDKENPDYRSRLVAKEIKRDTRSDLFAATPPLEAKKILFSLAVTEGIGYQRGEREKGSQASLHRRAPRLLLRQRQEGHLC